MKIRFKITVVGTVHGRPDGVKPGDVLNVDDAIGMGYCRSGYAEPVVDRKEERAVAPSSEERSDAPKPQSTKPRPGQKPTA